MARRTTVHVNIFEVVCFPTKKKVLHSSMISPILIAQALVLAWSVALVFALASIISPRKSVETGLLTMNRVDHPILQISK
jgi:hypothetical protein